jgi:acetate kinase
VKLAAFRTPGTRQRALRPAAERLLAERHDTERIDPAPLLRAFQAKLPAPVDVVAHRIVHGGTRFTAPARIDERTLSAIATVSDLAPLHNPPALRWIHTAREVFPEPAVQVAAFDTSFFALMPRVAVEYALPRSIGSDLGVRRYGFHGLAHEAMWRRWCELRPDLPGGGRIITMQLGGGCSITALAEGRPLDTSMGFSPLEGLVMATRSGDIDPAVVPYLQRQLGITSEEVIDRLNRESGLQGLSALSSNPGTLLQAADAQAQFAVELYCYRVRKYVGAYLAVLGGCDGLVFGGGVGEHVPGVRGRILAGLEWAGIEVDRQANEAARGAEAWIDTAAASVQGLAGNAPRPKERGAVSIVVIPVDEELVLVNAATAIVGEA